MSILWLIYYISSQELLLEIIFKKQLKKLELMLPN